MAWQVDLQLLDLHLFNLQLLDLQLFDLQLLDLQAVGASFRIFDLLDRQPAVPIEGGQTLNDINYGQCKNCLFKMIMYYSGTSFFYDHP